MPGQENRMTTGQQLAQKQVVTQKLIQSIKLMAMPLVDLRDAIQQEVEKNPALEVVREAGEVSELSTAESKNSENEAVDLDSFADNFDSEYQAVSKSDLNNHQRFLEGAITRAHSLFDNLLEQLHCMDLDDVVMELCEHIIWNLDSDGFHREAPETLFTSGYLQRMQEAIDIVRGLEPMGCACANWRESLVVQANMRGDAPENFDIFVHKALLLLEKKRPEDVRKIFHFTEDDWEDLENYIPLLNPFPGRLYSTEPIPFLIPDLEIRKEEDEYVLIINDEVLPVLQVDAEFEKMQGDAQSDKSTKRFISNHSRDARDFIKSLLQRESTLLKTARCIVDFQRDFFVSGPRFLKPLTLKDVASEVGLHETTISRITTNKYIQTEWGILELKYFFTNSISGKGAFKSQISKVAAKETIKEILKEFEGKKHISDQKISELLSRRGINLARRTVSKYRKELDLPSSFQR